MPARTLDRVSAQGVRHEPGERLPRLRDELGVSVEGDAALKVHDAALGIQNPLGPDLANELHEPFVVQARTRLRLVFLGHVRARADAAGFGERKVGGGTWSRARAATTIGTSFSGAASAAGYLREDPRRARRGTT